MRCGEGAVARRVDDVEPGADDGDRAGAAGERAFVRRGVDAERQARDDDPAGLAQVRREGARVVEPLRRRVAAADDRHRRRLEQLDPAAHVEQQRRVGAVEKQLRIARIADDDGVARLVAAARQPLPGRRPTRGELVRQRCASAAATAGPTTSLRAAVDAAIAASGAPKRASSARADSTADAGRLKQAQPRRELVAIDHVRVPAPRPK